jgi:RNA polymerase sigma-70 factor, ECF subfamily
MRQVLVEHARARHATKRGGVRERVSLDEAFIYEPENSDELLNLDDALQRLEALEARQCRIVELRYFGGLSIKEAAVSLGVSVSTVKADWALARAWLRRELGSRHDANVAER